MGNEAQRHWQGNFVNTNGNRFHEFNQSPLDEGNTITASAGQLISVYLKWNDTWGASGNDYDLLLYDKNVTLVAYSVDVQNGNDDPVECLDYTATYTGSYDIAIGTLGSPQVVNFHLYSSYHDLQYKVASSSLVIPADSPNAMSVGAVPWSNPTTLESFSSQGPTVDGRIKPDLVAPDGVSSVTYSPFFGTSASTPHTAGAAALVKQRYPLYTPAQIQAFLEGRAVGLGGAGKDNLFGSGRLDLGLAYLPPVAKFTANTTSGGAPLTVSFTDQSTGNISNWSWDFGDGGTSTKQSPSHQYTSAGTHTVSLTITGPGGTDTMTKSNYITVAPATASTLTVTGITDPVVAGTASNVTVTAKDAYGNTATGYTGTITFTSTDSQAVKPANYTFQASDNGVKTFSGGVTLKTVGERTVTATDIATGTITGSQTAITVAPGLLHHVVVSPGNAVLQASASQQFTAAGYDQYNNQIPGLSFSWSVINGGGSINGSGLFTAGAARGTFPGTVKASTTSGGVTKEATATVSVGAAITATVTLQGGSRPLSGMNVPFTAKLYDNATTLDSNNILTETPLQTSSTATGEITITNSDVDTKTNTLQIGGLPAGTYNFTLFCPYSLINLRNGVVVAAQGTQIDMGTLYVGNADESVQITGADFSLLLNDYLQVPGGAKWNNGRCDFDCNGQVTSVDFSLMIDNYNKTSPQIIQ